MYEMKRQITYSQVGSDLKTDIAMITNFLQDCALFHSESIGKGVDNLDGTKTAWFLSSWQIEVIRYPEYKEKITVRTWPHAFKGLYGYRNFDILDDAGNRIVQANSIWIFMDVVNMRPMKPSDSDIEGYDLEEGLFMDYAPRKIKILGESDEKKESMEPIPVKRSFIDSNHHVNNGRYVTEAIEYVDDVTKIRSIRVDYRKAAALGDMLYPVLFDRGHVKQIVFEDGEGQPYVIVEVMCE
ncbi:MAG: acyl-[acyl-carrier-protein] thioesterase [Lachnospiraceae bacterium]|nr:acyl-[acyl-carrier-protein] thioesterase [Lachnospiraceae bacterium]